MPSSHTTEVTKDKATLIYEIVIGKTGDMGKVIQNSIIQTATGANTVGLPFPNLSTELFQNVGVTWDKEEQVLKISCHRIPSHATCGRC